MTDRELLELADILQHKIPSIYCLEVAAAELRRLHEVNQELVEALKNLCDQLPSNPIPLSTYFAKDELLAARAALAKIKEST